MEKHEHHLFLVWLVFTGIVFFLLVLAWHQDIFYLLFSTDRSKISVAISLLYCCVTIHCAMRVFHISSQINDSRIVELMIVRERSLKLVISENKVKINNEEFLPDCLVTDYIHDLVNKTNAEKDNPEIRSAGSDHIEYYESKLKSPHDIGWFTADIMIKMGLLGTIVGFILMLDSVSNITDFDVTTMQKVLSYMSSGMGTALYTTLAGLVCSMLAATQYLMLDRSADDLIDSIRHLTRVYVLPRLN
jgi:flagellar motor component MotA